MLDVVAKSDELWNAGRFKKEIDGMGFIETSDFYKEKAIELSGGLKPGQFVNLSDLYGDVWIEVDRPFSSGFFSPVKTYRNGVSELLRNIDKIATRDEIADMVRNKKARIVYTRDGIYGGRNANMADFK